MDLMLFLFRMFKCCQQRKALIIIPAILFVMAIRIRKSRNEESVIINKLGDAVKYHSDVDSLTRHARQAGKDAISGDKIIHQSDGVVNGSNFHKVNVDAKSSRYETDKNEIQLRKDGQSIREQRAINDTINIPQASNDDSNKEIKLDLRSRVNQIPKQINSIPPQIRNDSRIFQVTQDNGNTYLINNEKMCQGKNVTYLIYVHTAPQNGERRKTLRDTWAKNSVIPMYESRIIFMVGNPRDDKVQADLYTESKIYGDIIQENYTDSYKNLTLKAISALKWISRYCNHVKFVFKTDDDIFLDLFHLMRLLRDKYWHKKRFFLGMVYQKDVMPILRDKARCARWCVAESEMRGKAYPRYLSGGFLVISGDLIQDLFEAAKTTPFFWVDDVYLSGLLPLKLSNISYFPINDLYLYFENKFSENFDPNTKTKYLVTLTNNRKGTYWYKTLSALPDNDKNMLGNNHYSELLMAAEKLATMEAD